MVLGFANCSACAAEGKGESQGACSARNSDERLEFEVASVKPSGPFVGGVSGVVKGGPGSTDPALMHFIRLTLARLVGVAFAVDLDQIKGPNWIMSDQYDIEARVPPDTTKTQANQMLQSLLADRFQLAIHHERRPVPAYEVTIAPGGIKMSPTSSPEAKAIAPGTSMLAPLGGYPQFPKTVSGLAARNDNGVRRFTGQAVSMAVLCQSLAANFGAIDGSLARVVDKTGPAGRFDFHFWYEMPSNDGAGLGEGVAMVSALMVALDRQLGLKILTTKLQLDTIVVDRALRVPTGN
jgi:uncharacterized protein (TIGR03435 family)